MAELDFMKQVDAGLKELDDGKWIPHEEVDKRMVGWYKGYGKEELDIAKDGLEWGLMFDIETVYNTILFEMIKYKSP